MENASKALLIAGSILIVILLIAVGMMVFNGARGSIDEAVSQMSAQDLQMFNQQFTQYAGTKVVGSVVKSLLEKVTANNLTYKSGEAKYMNTTGNSVSNVISSSYYIVKVEDKNPSLQKDGLMDTVIVDPFNP